MIYVQVLNCVGGISPKVRKHLLILSQISGTSACNHFNFMLVSWRLWNASNLLLL